jgi:hypothetical protein
MASTIIDYIEFPSLLNAETFKVLKTLVEDFPFCSTFRILFAKNHQVLKTVEVENFYKNTVIFVPDRKKFFRFMHDIPDEIIVRPHIPAYSIETLECIPKDKNIEDNQTQTDPKNALIEKFIREQPKILFKQSESILNEEDIPTESEAEQDFVSEILAELYWKQGNPERAIRTYEKLSLKIPEKSSYFAAQIEKIKNRII